MVALGLEDGPPVYMMESPGYSFDEFGDGVGFGADAAPAGSAGAALAARVVAAAPALAAAAARRGRFADAQDRALDTVRAFIAERRFVLYGGMAVDFALRARGRELYSADVMPDYDFKTPDHVGAAYDLVDRLGDEFGAELPRLRAVPGISAATFRVGFGEKFTPLADLSYVPPAIYAALPTLMHAGLRYVHPDFQRIDFHLALMFPMANPPLEDVFNRARKFTTRLAILDELWPIASDDRPYATATVTATLGVDISGPTPAVAIGGFAAYGLLRAALDELAAACRTAGAEPPPPVAAPPLAVRVTPRTCTAEVPHAGAAPQLEFASCFAAAAAGAGSTRRRAYLDAGFAAFVTADGGAVVEDTADRLLAVAPLRAAPASGALVYTLAPPGVLRGFALAAVRASTPPERELARRFYAHTVEVVRAAEIACAAAGEAGAELFAASPFGPGSGLLGGANRSPAYLNSIREAAVAVGDAPAGDAHPRPAAYHWKAGGSGRPAPFDYTTSSHFTHDGGDEPSDTPVASRGRTASPPALPAAARGATGGAIMRASSADNARADTSAGAADPDVRRFTARVPPRFW